MFRFFSLSLIFLLLFTAVSANDPGNETKTGSRAKRGSKKLILKGAPWGPTQETVTAAKQRAFASKAVTRELAGGNFRELGFEYIYNESEKKGEASVPPTHFRVIYYDYSSGRSLHAESDLAGKEAVTVKWVNDVPGIGPEEIAAAYAIADKDKEVAKFKGPRGGFYEPMPPTTVVNGERLVNIGYMDPVSGVNKIFGVSFKNGNVVRYDKDAPPTSAATAASCGVPNGNQPSGGQGFPGQFTLTVNEEGGTSPLWEMLIVRPSASSGANFERSGLEIRDVRYRGKSVLKRGHVPILNVKYTSGCGPFRDWQYSEGYFNAPEEGSTNPADAFRILAPGQVATTVVESRNDVGNFRGVAVYTEDVGLGTEVVLVTELNAGWYRYVMEWRFAQDGTIRPRFGFGSIADSCVCLERTHHVYWRFDFDVVGSDNRVFVMERGRRFLRRLDNEAALFRSTQLNRTLMVQNTEGDEAYQIVPGSNDGSVLNNIGELVDTFGGGDFWVMRFKGTPSSPAELDDPDGMVYPAANLSPWINNESILDNDVVVWYAAHQRRVDDSSRPEGPQVITGNHVSGPVLRPIRW